MAFASFADNLVRDDTNGLLDVFLRRRDQQTTTRLSVGPDGAQGNGLSFAPVVSADGAMVVFSSEAGNLVPDDSNGIRDVFLASTASGALTPAEPTGGGKKAQGDGPSLGPVVDASGVMVAFASFATNLVAGRHQRALRRVRDPEPEPQARSAPAKVDGERRRLTARGWAGPAAPSRRARAGRRARSGAGRPGRQHVLRRSRSRSSGRKGADAIKGTSGPDVIDGEGGDDVIDGGGGDDRICGSGGDDKITGGAGRDRCDGGSGQDTAGSCEDSTSIP